MLFIPRMLSIKVFPNQHRSAKWDEALVPIRSNLTEAAQVHRQGIEMAQSVLPFRQTDVTQLMIR